MENTISILQECLDVLEDELTRLRQNSGSIPGDEHEAETLILCECHVERLTRDIAYFKGLYPH